MARYSRFVIENFKGIRHAEVDLRTLTGANVFALVGLNESGKTTLLEAIHEFSPDFVSRRLVKPKKDDQESTIASYVPRHKIANFTGDIKVEATLVLTEEDQKRVLDFALHEYGLSFEGDSVPAEVRLERRHRFERGDYVDSTNAVFFPFAVKSGRQRKFRPATEEEKKQIWDSFYEVTLTSLTIQHLSLSSRTGYISLLDKVSGTPSISPSSKTSSPMGTPVSRSRTLCDASGLMT